MQTRGATPHGPGLPSFPFSLSTYPGRKRPNPSRSPGPGHRALCARIRSCRPHEVPTVPFRGAGDRGPLLQLRSRPAGAAGADPRLPRRGPLRDPGSARQGRDGDGLQGQGPQARRSRRDQGPAARNRGGSRDGAPLPQGDRAGAEGAPPQRLRHPRIRRRRLPALHRDGVHRGRRPPQGRARDRRPPLRGGLRHLPPHRGGAAGDPRRRHRPPRPEDGQPDARRPGRRAADGFRDREAGRRRGLGRRHRDRAHRGHARLHEPGAGARERGRSPQRHLRPRHRRLRALHGPACPSTERRRSRRS